MGRPSLNLIMSGAYVDHELVAEFGSLPPSFLPVGMGRLYDIQIDLFRKYISAEEKIYLVLPEKFNVSFYDSLSIEKKGVDIFLIPEGLNVGEAIVYCIYMLADKVSSVRILHGDTVTERLPLGFDVVASHVDSNDYSWAVINHQDGVVDNFEQLPAASESSIDSPVACGFFSFSNSLAIARSIVSARYDFIEGMNIYNKTRKISIDPVEEWYDFGHIQTYFHSRRMVTTARSFNTLQISGAEVFKSSRDHFKMEAEAKWLSSLPVSIRPYSVRMFDFGELSDNRVFYSTDYQYTPNLAELFVFSKVGRFTWKKILSSCSEFLEKCVAHSFSDKSSNEYLRYLVVDKTQERLTQYGHCENFDIDHPLFFKGEKLPSLKKISEYLGLLVNKGGFNPSTIMHGDFCFSNILYNSRNTRISVIDPRGYVFPGEHSICGDVRYDIAKFSHSINGLYDLIIAGRYTLTRSSLYDFSLDFEPSPMRDWLQSFFSRMKIAGISTNSKEIKAITALLFISMLPLHADRPDRQEAFIANVLRLFLQIQEC